MTKFNYGKSANNGTTAQRFIELLEKAKAKGLTGANSFNCESGELYSGKNALILDYVAMTMFKGCTAFLTWKQIESLGGSVKGQHGFPICKLIEKMEVDQDGNARKVKMIKYYTVFNLCQVHRRELDQAEQDLKDGKIKEIDGDLYTPIAVHYLKPKTNDQAVEIPADQIEVIAPKAKKAAKKVAKNSSIAKEITFKNSFIPAMWDSASASYSNVSYQ